METVQRIKTAFERNAKALQLRPALGQKTAVKPERIFMDPKLQRRIQRYGWDKAAPFYERYWQQQLEPAQAQLLVMAALRRGERVLDVACGTGLVSLRAAALVGRDGEVVGTDISEKMIESARQAAGEKMLLQSRFVRMDAETLTLPANYFDAALCALGLMYGPNPEIALTQMFQTLKLGGRAVAAVWGRRNHCGWAEIFPIVEARVESEVCPLFFQLGAGDLLQQTFAQAGFHDVLSQRISTILHYDSAAATLGAAFAGGPVALAYSRFNERQREEAHAEYLSSIASYRRGESYEIPGEFVIVRGFKTFG